MAKRFRDESEASQVLTETGAKRLKGELPENEGAWEGLAAGKLAAAPLPGGQHPYLPAPLRPANTAADSPDQAPHQQQWEQHLSTQHQQQQEQQSSPQQSPQQPQHWQQQQHPQADEAAFAAAAGIDWSNSQQVNAFLGWLHYERLRRHGQPPEQQQQQQQQQQPPGAA